MVHAERSAAHRLQIVVFENGGTGWPKWGSRRSFDNYPRLSPDLKKLDLFQIIAAASENLSEILRSENICGY